jgi:hypothetical protein
VAGRVGHRAGPPSSVMEGDGVWQTRRKNHPRIRADFYGLRVSCVPHALSERGHVNAPFTRSARRFDGPRAFMVYCTMRALPPRVPNARNRSKPFQENNSKFEEPRHDT